MNWIQLWESFVSAGPWYILAAIVMGGLAFVVRGLNPLLSQVGKLMAASAASASDLADRYERLVDRLEHREKDLQNAFEQQIKSVKDDLAAEKEARLELERQLAEKVRELETAQEEIKRLTRDLSTLQSNLSQVKKERDLAEGRAKKLAEEVEELRKKIDQLESASEEKPVADKSKKASADTSADSKEDAKAA